MNLSSGPPPPTGPPQVAEVPAVEQSGRWKAGWFGLGPLAPLIGAMLGFGFAFAITGGRAPISLVVIVTVPLGFLLGCVGSIVAGAIRDRQKPIPRGKKTRAGLTGTGLLASLVVAAVAIGILSLVA